MLSRVPILLKLPLYGPLLLDSSSLRMLPSGSCYYYAWLPLLTPPELVAWRTGILSSLLGAPGTHISPSTEQADINFFGIKEWRAGNQRFTAIRSSQGGSRCFQVLLTSPSASLPGSVTTFRLSPRSKTAIPTPGCLSASPGPHPTPGE